MTNDPDRRTYDVLRLLAEHEPIGSVRLTDHLRERATRSPSERFGSRSPTWTTLA